MTVAPEHRHKTQRRSSSRTQTGVVLCAALLTIAGSGCASDQSTRGTTTVPAARGTIAPSSVRPGPTTDERRTLTLVPASGSRPTHESVGETVRIIQDRLQGLGIDGSEVTPSGTTISVHLPHLGDAEHDAIENTILSTGEFTFHHVLADLGPEAPANADTDHELRDYHPGSQIVSGDGSRFLLGPELFDGTVLSSAEAKMNDLNDEWEVDVEVDDRQMSEVNDAFNECYRGADVCPPIRTGGDGDRRGAIAMVLDGEVVSAPTVNAVDLPRSPNGFVIVGTFTRESANALALAIRFGALPIAYVEKRS